jgi:flagellar basal-body rod modification protein FlgD
MAITETSGVTDSLNKINSGAAGGALSKLNDDLDFFLKMLTTQLQNQDPLNPMDTHEMTAQLVQFSQVEQSIKQSGHLENLVNLQTASADAAAVSYIGGVITAPGEETYVTDAGAKWFYTFEQEAESVQISVLDDDGKVVYSESGSGFAGSRNEFSWDLVDRDGAPLPQGEYTVRIGGLRPNGQSANVEVERQGMVTGVQSGEDGPELLLGDIRVPLNTVTKVVGLTYDSAS